MAQSTDPIFCDIETGPTQNPDIMAHIKSGIEAELSVKVHELRTAEIKVPGTHKKPETIAAYIADKKASIEDDVKAAIEAATAKYNEAWRATALEGTFGELFVAGLAFGNDSPVTIYEDDWRSPDREIKILRGINEVIDNAIGHHKGQQLVGHNILGFDRQFIRQRGIVRGVRMHPIFTAEVKPWDSHAVFDTMTQWSGDPRGRVRLDKLLVALGLGDIAKGSELDEEIDGAKVWDFIRDGKIDKVATYCAWDVVRCRAIWHRLNYRNPPAEALVI